MKSIDNLDDEILNLVKGIDNLDHEVADLVETDEKPTASHLRSPSTSPAPTYTSS